MSLFGGVKAKAYLDALEKKLSDTEVHAGFLEGARYEDGTPAAQVAFWNEYGTANIPPRPFFRQTLAEHSPEWGMQAAKLLKVNDYDVNKTLSQMGQLIRDQIENKMITFTDPPNAESTIKKKGFNAPLRHTNQLHTKFLGFKVKN